MSVTIKELQERILLNGGVLHANPFTKMRENLRQRQLARLDPTPALSQAPTSSRPKMSARARPLGDSEAISDILMDKSIASNVIESNKSVEMSAKDHAAKGKNIPEEEPQRQPLVTLSNRYYQDLHNPAYQPPFNSSYHLHRSPRLNSLLMTAVNMSHGEELERFAQEARLEKMMKPLAVITTANDNSKVRTIDAADLLFNEDFRPGKFEVFMRALHKNVKDDWDDIADEVEGVPFGPIPLGVTPGPNPCLKELNIPSFDMTAFIAQYPTYLHRQSALFYHFATPTGQHQYRQLFICNLHSLRSALSHATRATQTLFQQLQSLDPLVAIQELHRERQRQEDNAGETAELVPSNTIARHTSANASTIDSENDGARRRPNRRSRGADNDMKDYTGMMKDKRQGKSELELAENADAVREQYCDIEKRMEDAFFWREVLCLEVRMSEAALARVDCARTCTGILARMYGGSQTVGAAAAAAPTAGMLERSDDHGKDKGKSREDTIQPNAAEQNAQQLHMQRHADMVQLNAAQARWAMLGDVMRACWGKVVDRLILAFEDKGREMSSMGWRSLRTRHAGELWDVLEDGRMLEKFLKSDSSYWEVVSRAAATRQELSMTAGHEDANKGVERV